MRPLIPFALWLGALVLPVPEAVAPESTAALLTTVATLAGLTVMVYRLGVWRQDMHNIKYNVGAEIARYREETNQHFARFDRRFDSIDRHIAAATEQRVASERWRARVDTTLTGHERDLTGLGQRMDRLEGVAHVEAA
jgi:hypothetical protein